jgi:hypothetical protein
MRADEIRRDLTLAATFCRRYCVGGPAAKREQAVVQKFGMNCTAGSQVV